MSRSSNTPASLAIAPSSNSAPAFCLSAGGNRSIFRELLFLCCRAYFTMASFKSHCPRYASRFQFFGKRREVTAAKPRVFPWGTGFGVRLGYCGAEAQERRKILLLMFCPASVSGGIGNVAPGSSVVCAANLDRFCSQLLARRYLRSVPASSQSLDEPYAGFHLLHLK
jgi:hypothetical protein